MASPFATGVTELILDAKQNPAIPIIGKAINRGDRVLIHGYEETFKSYFAMEIARCIATGRPFFGELRVAAPQRVAIIQTEMRNPGLGERLAGMFPNPEEAANIRYLNGAGLEAIIRAKNFDTVVKILGEFLTEEECEVVIFDVSANLFKGGMDPDKEDDVQLFFDQLETIKIIKNQFHIRHDGKPKPGGNDSNRNNLIRGSSRWKEIPETILDFCKKGNSEVVGIEIGKLRYGRKPKPFGMRFDRVEKTVVPANPVLYLLHGKELATENLEKEFKDRYGLEKRTLEHYVQQARPFLEERSQGHKKLYSRKPGLHPDFIWSYKDAEEQ